jgi:hypothetical protein
MLEQNENILESVMAASPMTLGNMRYNGTRSVAVTCNCGHEAVVNCDRWLDGIGVPNIRFLLRCSKCGERPRETRPNWLERQAPIMTKMGR